MTDQILFTSEFASKENRAQIENQFLNEVHEFVLGSPFPTFELNGEGVV